MCWGRKVSVTFLRKQSNLANRVWNSRDKSKSSVVTLLSNHSFLERSRKECIFCKSLSLSLPPPLFNNLFSHAWKQSQSVCQSCKAAFSWPSYSYCTLCVFGQSALFSHRSSKGFQTKLYWRGLESKFYALSAQGSFPSNKMLWKQQTLKAASRGCVRLKHWAAHKWNWFQISWLWCLIYFQMKTNKETQMTKKCPKPNKTPRIYPQPQPTNHLPCLNKIAEKFSDINKGQPFSLELITLRAFSFSHTVF